MTAEVLIGIAGVFLVAAVGAVLTVRTHRLRQQRDGAASPLVATWRRTRDHLVADIGRIPAGLLVGAAGAGITFAVGWPLGGLAHVLQPHVDVPVFHWFQAHLHSGAWTSVQGVLTKMGNRPEIKLIAVVSAGVLAVLWRRRWWVPVLVIAAAFVVEKYVQSGLGKVVHRGHPPTTHGTYPSGGCARLISMYGTILYLAIRTWRPSLWVRGALWTLLAEAAWLEGYARTYRLEHWVTDVVGGWIVGSLLLLTFVATASTLGAPTGGPEPAEPHSDRPAVESVA